MRGLIRIVLVALVVGFFIGKMTNVKSEGAKRVAQQAQIFRI